MPNSIGGMSYTRHKYIHSIPQPKIKVFNIGDKKGDYSHVTFFKASSPIKINSDSLEAARVTANKVLEKSGKPYLLKIVLYPHEITREHKFMGFAGADRLSQGMSRSFGRPTSRSVRISTDQDLIAVWTKKEDVDLAKTALKRAGKKLPVAHTIVVEELKTAQAEV